MFLFGCMTSTSGGGEGGAGGTTGSTTSDSTTSSGVITVVPVPCVDCLSEPIRWGYTGGLAEYTETESLTDCRTFTWTRTQAFTSPVGDATCSNELGGCNAPPLSIHHVETALAHPDVIAAFAGSTTLYGTDPRPCDGSVFTITKGETTISLGGDCGTTSGCIQGQPCIQPPPGLRELQDVLIAVGEQQACAPAP